jgi:hypothetical protein
MDEVLSMVTGVVNDCGMRRLEDVTPESAVEVSAGMETVLSDLESGGSMTLRLLDGCCSNGGGWGADWSIVSGDVLCLKNCSVSLPKGLISP